MTLNFNVFPTAYLREIGCVPTNLTGYFNDVVMADRIRRDGRKVLMVPNRCVHYGSLTVNTGGTTTSREKDRAAFASMKPDLFDERNFWGLRVGKITSQPLLRALSWATVMLPFRWRNRIVGDGMTILTYLTGRT